LDFLSRLFDTSGFVPRWQCGDWSGALGWLHVLSDLGVWSAYVAIPCVLAFFVLNRSDLPFRKVFVLFVAFILACGTTHLMDASMFWWPAYRLAGVIKLVTAIVSWATVIALVPIIPITLKLRTVDELQREIAARTEAEEALQHANSELEKRVAALRNSEERFRLLVEGTKEYAIFLLDPAGHVASWNPGAERIKRYRAEEIIGQHFSRFYTAEDIQSDKPTYELKMAGSQGSFEDEGWRVRKDGTQFFANVVITALRDESGNLRGFSKITRDITEKQLAEQNTRQLMREEAARKAAEEQLQVIHEQREILQVTLASIGDAVISTDAEGRVAFLNPVAEKLTGWSRDEAHGMPLEKIFKIIHEQTREPVENPCVRAIREGIVVGHANHTLLVAKEGTECPVDDSAAPIKDAAGKVLGSVLVFRDVTERKATEQALKEAERRKDEFLAVLAHELRNPLAPIANSLQIMRVSENGASGIAPLREMMERQVRQMTHLVDDLLDVSRISSGKIVLRKERLDLAEVVGNALETSRPLIEEARHVFELTLPPRPFYVEGDKTRLAQVLSNLLANAVKYTPEEGRIWLDVSDEDTMALIRVRDTGVGIPEDMLPLVFEMFTQVDRNLGRSQGGLGIGLALVRSLIEMHGGSVEAHSNGPGSGSEFQVRLPLVQPAAERETLASDPHPEPQPAAESPVERRILIVDDNRDSAETLAMLLKIMGNDVRIAFDGPSALQIAIEYLPQLVLLDIGLPGMSGHEVAQRIRQTPAVQDVVLVAQTGWGQDEDKRRSEAAGFNAHLVKPIDTVQLRNLLTTLSTTLG
jgi:PAS domain S-box-containing protein